MARSSVLPPGLAVSVGASYSDNLSIVTKPRFSSVFVAVPIAFVLCYVCRFLTFYNFL